MFDWIQTNPGRLYVVGTLLPLAGFALLLVAGGIRALCKPFRQQGGLTSQLYWALGGDTPAKGGAYLATALMGTAAVIGVAGLVLFLNDHSPGSEHTSKWAERTDWIRIGPLDSASVPVWEKQRDADPTHALPRPPRWRLELGYKIDHLTALMFAMVTVIGTGIFIFSLGYMRDETDEKVEDHEVDKQTVKRPSSAEYGHGEGHPHTDHAHGHFSRHGRFGRFFLYLSLFCFSMLNLVIADNLFQVFVSWELVGVCSFFLIGFYYERPSASKAANKAFIVNRIGDAGFLVGILIAWVYFGTLNFEELNRRARSPVQDTHGKLAFANQLVRVNAAGQESNGTPKYALPPKRSSSAPASTSRSTHSRGKSRRTITVWVMRNRRSMNVLRPRSKPTPTSA